MSRQYRIAIVAGEASGDLLGASLIQALKARLPNVSFFGVAGPHMQAAGCESLFPMETLSVMGITEVICHLPQILKARKKLLQTCLQSKPDLYIGIDSPDFNLPVAKKLKASGVKTVQYVSPSVWAWRKNRIHGIKASTDLVLCLLPFETEIYQKFQHPAKFVGHPLADSIPMIVDKCAARDALQLDAKQPCLAILPGSRGQEIKALLLPFLQTAAFCRQNLPHLQLVLPLIRESLRPLLSEYQDLLTQLQVKVVVAQSHAVLAAADVVLLASGTATLETMLFKKPMVVAYRLSKFTYWLAKKLVKLKYFSLPNLLANKPLVIEFLQQQVNSDNLGKAVLTLFENAEHNKNLIDEFSLLHLQLKQNASVQAAEAIIELLGIEYAK